jgi:hypothetical protein
LKSDIHSQLALRSDPVICARPSSLPVCRRLCQLSKCTVFKEDGKHPLRVVDTIGSPWTCLSFQKEPCILIAFNSNRVDTVSTRDIRDLDSRPSFRNRPSVVSFRTNRLLTLQFLTSHVPSHISSHISAFSHLSVLASLSPRISQSSHLYPLTSLPSHISTLSHLYPLTPLPSHTSTLSHLYPLTSLPSHTIKRYRPLRRSILSSFHSIHLQLSPLLLLVPVFPPLSLYVAKVSVIMTPPILSTKEWLNKHRMARSKIINMLAKRKHTLALRIKERLERNRELSESDRAYVMKLPRGQHKDYILSKTKHGLLDVNQISELDGMFKFGQSITGVLTRNTRTQRYFSIHYVQNNYP